MVNKKIQMNILVVKILEKDSFDNFSISQLKDAYMNLCSDTSPIEARKLVYKQVIRLVKLGGLTKNGNKNSRSATYRKSDFFNKIVFVKKSEFIRLDKTNLPGDLIKNNDLSINGLKTKLHEYKADMISATGESEEYIQLTKSFPNMKAHLKKECQSARDKSSKLLGQMKAIKTLIRLQESL